jgi:glycolate oxidase FAD binding subunit
VIPGTALRALRDAAGADAVREHDPEPLGPVKPAVTVTPADGETLAATLAALSREGLAALVRGGGTRRGAGNLPRAGDLWLACGALGGVEVDPDEGVARAGAGATLAELDAAARAAGWRSPLDLGADGATVGGALASGVPGPRAPGLGAVHAAVLGLDVTLASGERTRCGGRVVKNVSGYDLRRLYVGSHGSLGVIEGAWLRLRPRPEAEAAFTVRDPGEVAAVALAASRRPSVRLAAWTAPEDAIHVEWAGDAAGVEADTAWLRSCGEARPLPEGRIDLPEERPAPDVLRFRLAAPPSRLAEVRDVLVRAGARCVLHPALATAVADFTLSRADEAAADAAWRAARAAAAGGPCLLASAPDWAREARDVFALPPHELPLARALKRQWDPDGVLNPGRFAGGL